MTRQDREAEYIRRLLYPEAFLYSSALTGIDQAADRPPQWGTDAPSYGHRFRDIFARHEIAVTLQEGLALGLDEDNRYFRSGRHGLARLGYALSSPFLARHSDGSRTLSISALGGVAGASLLEETWMPANIAGMTDAGRSIGLTFAFRAGIDVVREFAPRPLARFLQ